MEYVVAWDRYLCLLSVQIFAMAYDGYEKMLIFKIKSNTASWTVSVGSKLHYHQKNRSILVTF